MVEETKEKETPKEAPTITEDEAALYDRQIRLWGLDAQRRLRGACVLMIGAGGLAAEVSKNIVLSGIKSLTLMDDALVSKEDFCNQFFISRADLGKNRAESSVARVQLLNPMVDVSADPAAVADKPDAFFKDFDIVCATSCTRSQQIRINTICRENGIKFYSGDVFGYYGYMFADLIKHQYAEDVPKPVSKQPENGDGDAEPAAKKVRTMETVTVKKEATFSCLKDSLETDWSKATPRTISRTPNTYFIMQILEEFRELNHRSARADKIEEDKESLSKLRLSVLDRLKVEHDVVAEDFSSYCFAGLSPVCAVVGGVLGQEIIKAVSQKDAPHNNFFFFNGVDGSGMVDCINK